MDQTVQHVAIRAVDSINDFWLGFIVCLILFILIIREVLNLIKWYKGYKKTEEGEEAVSGNSVQRFIQLLETVVTIERTTNDTNNRIDSLSNDCNASFKDLTGRAEKNNEDNILCHGEHKEIIASLKRIEAKEK